MILGTVVRGGVRAVRSAATVAAAAGAHAAWWLDHNLGGRPRENPAARERRASR